MAPEIGCGEVFTCAFSSLDIDKGDTIIYDSSPVDVGLVVRDVNAVRHLSASNSSQGKENKVLHLDCLNVLKINQRLIYTEDRELVGSKKNISILSIFSARDQSMCSNRATATLGSSS